MFNFNEFVNSVYTGYLNEPYNQRYGQYIMNTLARNYPSIQVPQEIDCYYNNDLIPDVLNYLSNLNDEESKE